MAEDNDWIGSMAGAAAVNPYVAGAMAIYSGVTGNSNAKKQRRAMEQAQHRSRIALEKSLSEAKQQLGPYSEIGTRDGLYKLAALMGDDRFGSQEAAELYELESKVPIFDEGAFRDSLPEDVIKFGMADDFVAQAKAVHNSHIQPQYLKRKAELEAIVAKQKADGTYRKSGFDYISGTEAYKNRLNEGQRNMLRGMAANRGVFSGGALKDLEKYGQDYAANEYNQEFSRLATLAGMGQQARTAVANAGMGQGTNLANIALQGGTTAANYYDNQNNVTQGTLENIITASERKRKSSYDPYKTTIGGG